MDAVIEYLYVVFITDSILRSEYQSQIRNSIRELQENFTDKLNEMKLEYEMQLSDMIDLCTHGVQRKYKLSREHKVRKYNLSREHKYVIISWSREHKYVIISWSREHKVRKYNLSREHKYVIISWSREHKVRKYNLSREHKYVNIICPESTST